MFNLQEYLEKTEKEFDGKWNLWHETTEQRNAVKSFLRSAIENAVNEAVRIERQRLRGETENKMAENQKYIDAYYFSKEDQKPYQEANKSLSDILKLLED